MSKDGENRSLAQIVQEFKDWNHNLHQASAKDSSKTIMDGVDQKEFMLTTRWFSTLRHQQFWKLQRIFEYLAKQRPIDSYALEEITRAQRKVLHSR